jgi:hypothetical protein
LRKETGARLSASGTLGIGGIGVGRSHHRGRIPSARTLRRAKHVRPIQSRPSAVLPRLRLADRKSLLLGTALASTLLIVSLLAPPPAQAVTTCPPGSGQILINVADDIVCVNVDDRTFAGSVIDLTTTGGNSYINLYNSGFLTANAAGSVSGITTSTTGGNSPITIVMLAGSRQPPQAALPSASRDKRSTASVRSTSSTAATSQ